MLTTAILPIALGALGLIAAFLVYAKVLQTQRAMAGKRDCR